MGVSVSILVKCVLTMTCSALACQLQLPKRAFLKTDRDFKKGPAYCIPRQFLGATAGLQQVQSTSRNHLHSPIKHLFAPTGCAVQSTCWQVPLPNTSQVQASYKLTTTTHHHKCCKRSGRSLCHSFCWKTLTPPAPGYFLLSFHHQLKGYPSGKPLPSHPV